MSSKPTEGLPFAAAASADLVHIAKDAGAGTYNSRHTSIASILALVPDGGLVDGDYGDVVVSAGGTAMAVPDLALKINATEKGSANGVSTLDAGGKIPTAQLPALAITDVFVVASEAAQLALTAEEGDVAIRTDESTSYIHNGGTAGTMADWQQLLQPGGVGSVTSVAGKTGVVTLVPADVGLGNVDNTSDANKPVSTAQQTALNLKIDATEKGAANGVSTLDAGGKIPTTQLPALAITDVSVVANEAAQLALTAQEGDVAIRSDLNKSYIHNGGVAGTMADWSELLTPTDAVLSVAGLTGAITAGGLKTALSLVKGDVGLGNVDNTSDANKPVSTATQNALDAKADAFAGVASFSTSQTAADSWNNGHRIASGASRVLTLNSTPSTGCSFSVRFTTAWTITCTSLSKNGATPVSGGSVAAGKVVTFIHEGAGTWLAVGDIT